MLHFNKGANINLHFVLVLKWSYYGIFIEKLYSLVSHPDESSCHETKVEDIIVFNQNQGL